MMLSVPEMIGKLSTGDAIVAVWIEPTDREGLWLRARNGMDGVSLKSTVEQFVDDANWLVTSVHGQRILIEPWSQTELSLGSPYVFHVSDRKKRLGILSGGLQPKDGGNTQMNRTYPCRIFFAMDMLAAFEFIEFQCGDKKQAILEAASFLRQMIGPSKKNAKFRDELDLWRVRVPPKIKLYRDVLFPGRACWTDSPIPKQNVKLLRLWNWREKMFKFFRWRGLL